MYWIAYIVGSLAPVFFLTRLLLYVSAQLNPFSIRLVATYIAAFSIGTLLLAFGSADGANPDFIGSAQTIAPSVVVWFVFDLIRWKRGKGVFFGKPLFLLPLVIVMGMFALFIVGMQREGRDDLPSTLEGRAAPAVQVQPLGEGPEFAQANLTAPGVKLVNFWASWCAPCRVEHPNLQALATEGVVIHGVNYKDQPDKALGFLAELGNPYATLGADASGRMGLDWGLYGVPETFVIDAEGKVILRFPGPITERVLAETIRPALAGAIAP